MFRCFLNRFPHRTPPFDEFLDRHRTLLWVLLVGCAVLFVVGLIGIVSLIVKVIQ